MMNRNSRLDIWRTVKSRLPRRESVEIPCLHWFRWTVVYAQVISNYAVFSASLTSSINFQIQHLKTSYLTVIILIQSYTGNKITAKLMNSKQVTNLKHKSVKYFVKLKSHFMTGQEKPKHKNCSLYCGLLSPHIVYLYQALTTSLD